MKLIAALMLAMDLNGQPLPDVVLLGFTANYCAPCQQMIPVLQGMEKDKFPIRKIDITQQPDVSRQYKVDRIPTLILLVKGQEQKRFVGLTDGNELRQAMNDAARRLDAERNPGGKTSGSDPITTAATEKSADSAAVVPTAPKTAATEAKPESGLRGVLERVRNGFGGTDNKRAEQLERPDFRAQSPDGPSDSAKPGISLPMLGSVRVRVVDGKLLDFGTGTVIHSVAGQSIVATCAHLFQNVGGTAVVSVDVFRDGQVLSYPAKVLGGDHDADVAILQIQNKEPLPTVSVAWKRPALVRDEAVFSIGCSNGDLPTRMNVKIVEVNRYQGPDNILCTVDPSQGRSGGGLFDSANNLIGICSAADRKAKEGLYAGVPAIDKLVTQLKLKSLFNGPNGAPEAASKELTVKEPALASSLSASPAAPTAPPNPFEEQDVFAQMFDDLAASPTATGSVEKNTAPSAKITASLPDPFAPIAPVVAPAVSKSSPGTEITVIIDARDGSGGKQVIVIPKASPWLLELLTGDGPANHPVSRQQTLSATSVRQRQ